jgi:CRP/FNR family transcriptional regulator
MISPDQVDRVVKRLPVLQQAGPELLREFMQSAFLAHIPAGRDVFLEGDRVQSIALLISGVVRVYKIGETGREITLYRFGLGESCILTANAILSYQSFPAIATVEQDAEAVMVPADIFRDWVGRFDLWRRFVFDLLALRLATVLAVVDEVAFRRMDARVAELLLQRVQAGRPLRITHQEIAAELGSSREVISRILEDFADRGSIRTGRGTIEIVNAQGLRAYTAV